MQRSSWFIMILCLSALPHCGGVGGVGEVPCEISIDDTLRTMCPEYSDQWIQAAIDALGDVCRMGEPNTTAVGMIAGRCIQEDGVSAALHCGFCESTIVDRMWQGGDTSLSGFCPALDSEEIQVLTSALALFRTLGDTRSMAVGGAVEACLGAEDSAAAAVTCAVCEAPAIDRVWRD